MITAKIPVKTTNPLNGATGNSRLAAIIRTRQRGKQRETTREVLGPLAAGGKPAPPWLITLTRIAPSNGLDDDALPASCKGIRDGIADVLGVPNDRDPRYKWEYAQRRGAKGQYAVDVVIESRAAEEPKGAA